MKRTLLGLCAAGACALSAPAWSANDTFIQFDSFKGPAVQVGHESWSEVLNWSWSVTADASWIKGGGAAVGKPQPGPFTWTQHTDAVYIELFKKLVTGTDVTKVKLDVTKQTGSSSEVFFSMEFDNVFFTRLDQGGSSDGLVDYAGQFVYKTVKIGYREQDPKSGKLGAFRFATWNVSTNSAGIVAYEFSGDPTALLGLNEAMPLAVPEPATALLMLGGLGGVLGLARRRLQATQA